MTTLIAFSAADSRGPAALYLASDSRISWGANRDWDAGRKVFNCHVEPHAFGYCGDVVFPALLISQLVELIDAQSIFAQDEGFEERDAKVLAVLQSSFGLRRNTPNVDFSLLHAARQGDSTRSEFFISRISYSVSSRSWSRELLSVPKSGSALIIKLGSGASQFERHVRIWQMSAIGGTSRAIFGAFCAALDAGQDIGSGGAPQLVGIYRVGAAKAIGTVHDGVRYLCGLPVDSSFSLTQLEWRDELFQRIDGSTLQLMDGAQVHAKPKGVV
ncbi:hypothetical protein OOZ54_19130 [Rhodopseudomonas palustris]|uniref:hypothetical protein n=1 Tax=Rhodopseudomonas palustris TaxID=1076 RepID=UPI0022F088C4|nr:hypothetical protein [Rhodopseudomonas palustris]WBU28755.1 hypothetical protein OOZ54_19130 [Rhodopseudomonas palustris]